MVRHDFFYDVPFGYDIKILVLFYTMKQHTIFKLFFIAVCMLGNNSINAQNLESTKKHISILCGPTMSGRGYVQQGVNVAADYLSNQFQTLGLRKFGKSYVQNYQFEVNTHPYPIQCKLDGQSKQVGLDFLVDPSTASLQGKYSLIHFNMRDSLDKILLYKKIEKGFDQNHALVLHHGTKRGSADVLDSLKNYRNFPSCIIYTEDKKMTHSIGRKIDPLPSLIFMDSVIAQKETIDISIKNSFVNNFESKNIIGYIKAKKSDSFVVFTAHYDHLGKQGDAVFPGASDNASGTAMVLYLAEYFMENKPKDNMVFILFSGEEAGLLGSEYFTQNPTFQIEKIKMLVNIDIMGDAEKGITVVNGETFKQKFDQLLAINAKNNYLPDIKIRGKTKNSDHYYFSEKGIPSFFIYSNSGKGFYHDVFDQANTLALTNFEQVAKLLIDFALKQ